MTIGERIKVERERLILTQEELAERVQCSRTTISNYETNLSTPNNKILERIAKVLEVSVDYLKSDITTGTYKERMSENSKTIGNLVKSYRKMERISQIELADMLELDQSVISKIETGNLHLMDSRNVEIKDKVLDIFPQLKNYIESIGEVAISMDIDNSDNILGDRLRKLRESKSLSLRDLQEHIGRNHSAISSYENGKYIPPYETLEKYAEYFNVSIDNIIGGIDLNKSKKEAIAKGRDYRKQSKDKSNNEPYPYKNTGDIIYKFRTDNNMTRNYICDKLGCDINKLYRLEVGEHDIHNHRYSDIKNGLCNIFPGLREALDGDRAVGINVHCEYMVDKKEPIIPIEEAIEDSDVTENIIDDIVISQDKITDFVYDTKDVFAGYDGVKDNMSVLIFDYLHNKLISISGQPAAATKDMLDLLEREIEWYCDKINDDSILKTKLKNLRHNLNK